MTENREGPDNSEKQPIDRRRAIKKLGTYGLYTAPAMLAVLDAAQAQTVTISGFENDR